MTIVTTGMGAALDAMAEALRSSPEAQHWRWQMRSRMAAVRDALAGESGEPPGGWLAARGGNAQRERDALLARLSVLGPLVLEHEDLCRVRTELHRLVVDISHHLQRLHDLAYDEVALELGGSD